MNKKNFANYSLNLRQQSERGRTLRMIGQGLVVLLVATFLFMLVIFSGVDAGNSQIFDTLMGGSADDITEGNIITIGDDDLVEVAEAGNEHTGTTSHYTDASLGSSAINKSWKYTYGGSAGSNLRRRFYWQGNSSNNNYSAGGGQIKVWTSGTVRQKNIVASGYTYIRLTGNLATLASAGKLKITAASGYIGTTNNYVQNVGWGVANGVKDIDSGTSPYSSPNLTIVGGFSEKEGGGVTKSASGMNVNITSNKVTIGLVTRCNWTKWVGGRLCGAELTSISITFTSSDTSAPSLSQNGGTTKWAQSKTVTFTPSDAESGTPMHSRSVSTTYGGLSNSGNNFVISNVTGTVSGFSVTNKSGVTGTFSFSADAMKIDTTNPSVSMALSTSSSSASTPASGTMYQQLYIRVTANDNQSGVQTVTMTGSDGLTAPAKRTGPGTTNTDSISGFSNGTHVYGPVTRNGRYNVTVEDRTGRRATSYIDVFYIDTQAPTVTYSLSNSSAETTWVKDSVEATFTVTEKADSAFVSACNNDTFKNAHKLKSFSVTYNSAALTLTKSSETFSTSTGAWTVVYKVTLARNGKYTYKATDQANFTSGDKNLTVNIDTSAPRVTNWTLSPTNITSKWSRDNVSLTLNVTDTASGGFVNQGSGVKNVTLYKGSIGGTVVETKAPTSGVVTFNITDDYHVTSTYYWLITDNAGNTSQLTQANKSFNNSSETYSPFYKNENTKHFIEPIRKDSTGVTLQVLSSGGAVLSDGVSSKNVTLQWTNAETTPFTLSGVYGPSGLKVEYATSSGTFTAANATWNVITSYSDAIADTAHKKGNNAFSTSYTAAGEGKNYYMFRVTNGAGVSAVSGLITVQRDRTNPTATIVGFGEYSHSSAVNSIDSIKARISGYKAPSSLEGSTWYDNYIDIIVAVTDSGSGVSDQAQTYNSDQNTTASQTSKAGGKYTFSHNGQSYTVTKTYQQGDGIAVMVVRLANLTEIDAKLPGLVILKGQGVPFQYSIQVADFCGNYANVTKSNGSSALDYKIDPYNLKVAVSGVSQTDSNGNVSSYKFGMAGDWTRNSVTVDVSKSQLGLSPVSVKYLTQTVIDNSDGTVGNMFTTVSPTDSRWEAGLVQGDTGSSSTAKIVFGASSRIVQVAVMVTNLAGKTAIAYGKDSEHVIIRQDIDAPNMNGLGYFFSTNPNLTTPYVGRELRDDVLLYYQTVGSATYVSTRKTENNKNDVNVWIHQGVYLYITATDSTGVAGSGMGSGIKTVSLTVSGENVVLDSSDLVNYDINNYQGTYRSRVTYGYENTTVNYGFELRFYDNQGNNSSFSFSRDSNNNKIFPVIDTVVPWMAIDSATYGADSKSYLEDGKFIGADDKVIKTDLNVGLKVTFGYSDANIYIRKRAYQSDLPSESLLLTHNSDSSSKKFGFIKDTGEILGTTSTDPKTGWMQIGGKTITAPAEKGSWNYTISSSEAVKDRFDILIVTGTGAYFYIEAGDVFIDTQPPVIHEDMTFYALQSAIENQKGNSSENPISYGVLEENNKIATLSTNTNDSLYAYFLVTDENGSGVDDNLVVTVNPTKGTVLEKVYVERVGKVEAYYRMLMTDNNGYNISATDVAGNTVENEQVTARIDKADVTLVITMTDAKGALYEFDKGAYTNTESITVLLDVSYGISGLGRVEYCYAEFDGTSYGAYGSWQNIDKIAGKASWERVNDSKSTLTFTISAEQNRMYMFRAFNGVTVYRVDAEGKDIVPVHVRGGDTDLIKVAIDHTAPAVNMSASKIYLNGTEKGAFTAPAENSGKPYGTNIWYNEGISIGLSVADKPDPTVNEGAIVAAPASGIDVIKVDHMLGGVHQAQHIFSYDATSGLWVAKDFLYSHYAEYKITLTDRAGNESSVTILPKIDTVVPSFDGGLTLTQVDKGDNDIELGGYVAGTWTKNDVKSLFNGAYSISGARLEYSRKAPRGNFSDWASTGVVYNYGSFGVDDDGKKHTTPTPRFYKPEGTAEGTAVSFDYEYKFRLVSTAGLVSEELVVGRIMIDQEIPVIDANMSISSGNLVPVYATKDTEKHVIEMNKWTGEVITITVNSPSTLASGYTLYYNLSIGADYNAVDGSKDTGTEEDNFQLKSSDKTFIHRIEKDSVYNGTYSYYFVSGSGIQSEVFTVSNVKRDSLTPSLGTLAKSSNIWGTINVDCMCKDCLAHANYKCECDDCKKNKDNANYKCECDKCQEHSGYKCECESCKDIANGGVGDYLATTTADNFTEDLPSFKTGSWTKDNSVIIKVSIGQINVSGVTVKINGHSYETFDYADYLVDGVETVNADNPLDRYYVVSNDYRSSSHGYFNTSSKKFEIEVSLVSGAGISTPNSWSIGIDNEIPFIYVAGIEGTKSTNWDGTVDNSWYVGTDTSIGLSVGVLQQDGDGVKMPTDERGNFITPNSGYTIYYSINGGEWIDNSQTNVISIIGMPITERTVYRFKIVSTSGMEYILGETAKNNVGEDTFTTSAIKAMVEGQSGLINHLTAEDFSYLINADSAEYYVNTRQLLPFIKSNGERVEEDRSDFASYVIKKKVNTYDADGNVSGYDVITMGKDDYIYRHGDRITIEYVSNVGDKYYHRYSEYGTIDADGAFVEDQYYTYGVDTDTDENAGVFAEYKFDRSNLNIRSYFLKELSVSYAGTVIYKQVTDDASVTAGSTYKYLNEEGGNMDAEFTLSVEYTTMDGTPVSEEEVEVGGYLVNAFIEGDNKDSFRLLNPQTVLLVKYFAETVDERGEEIPNSVSVPYVIEDAVDLRHVSAQFYRDFSEENGVFTLGTAYNYFDCAFEMTESIVVEDGFNIAEFNGSFDGLNNTVTTAGGEVTDDFGLFHTLRGTVKNLAVNVVGLITVNGADNVGVLASTVEGGVVTNVRVDADMKIISTTASTNVGGLAGIVSGNAVIGIEGAGVFADVVIYNGGYDLSAGNVGGITGSLLDTARLQYTYTYSAITLYNVNNVNAGAVVGYSDRVTFAGETVYETYTANEYVENNLFINDVAVDSFVGNGSAVAEGAVKSVKYDAFVGTASNVPGSKTIANEKIRILVLSAMYDNFVTARNSVDGSFENGLGTKDSPFVITTKDQLRAIDNYVNLYYVLVSDVDMSAFGQAIGLHKVFGGNFDGGDNQLTNISDSDFADGKDAGLFAAVSGTVSNLIFPDVEMTIEGGAGTVYAGIVTGRLLGGTISNIIAIGNIEVISDEVIYGGAIAGTATAGNMFDIFSIVNIKASAGTRAVVGGIVGRTDGTVLGGTNTVIVEGNPVDYDKAVYALGRVEISSISSAIGAISAEGTVSEESKAVFAVKDNAYSNGQVINVSISNEIALVTFDDSDMRKSTFSDGTNVFDKVFVSEKLYYLEGLGTATDKFVVSSAEDFRKIEHMLYANYNVSKDITFDDSDEATAFKTIGYGLKFTGSIDGKNANSWSAEEGTLSSLMNVTDALVYENAGSITDLGVNVYYDRTVESGEELVFGAIAVINGSGTLRNVTVSGEINIVGADMYDTTAIVSGFVGLGLGGVFEADSKVQNSISGLEITVTNVGTVYAGGYVGKVDGTMTLSYGIGNGTMTITDCGTVYAGTIVGAAYKENVWTSLEETAEYRYEVTVDGVQTTELYGYKNF